MSFGSILVKWNTEAPPLTIAFFRMLWAAVLLFPFYVRERAISAKRGRTALPLTSILLAGLGLALHFAFWITSLRHTSVAVSVFLVNTAPLMVALLAFLLWRERLTLAGAAGIVVAVSGAAACAETALPVPASEHLGFLPAIPDGSSRSATGGAH